MAGGFGRERFRGYPAATFRIAPRLADDGGSKNRRRRRASDLMITTNMITTDTPNGTRQSWATLAREASIEEDRLGLLEQLEVVDPPAHLRV